MKNYFELKNCVCCGSTNLETFFSLGNIGLANTYLSTRDDHFDKYPLDVNYCPSCFHAQMKYYVDPTILFESYSYVSGTTNTLKNYFKWFAQMAINNLDAPENKNIKILDIASNDGSQLKEFIQLGYKNVLGIDPAKNLTNIAFSNGVCTINDFFTKNVAEKIWRMSHNEGLFDIILAQNVCAHVSNPKEFLDNAYTLLSPKGKLYVQTSQANIMLNKEFDTFYHEHISFFNVNSFTTLVEKTWLKIVDFQITDIHGGSYLWTLMKDNNKKQAINIQPLKNRQEQESCLLDKKIYLDFSTSVKNRMKKLETIVAQYRTDGYKIVGYGAAAKSMAVLNLSDIKLDYICDENKLKFNRWTSTNSPTLILDANKLLVEKSDKLVIIVLAWNFYDEIKNKILKLRRNKKDILIRYFPSLEVERLNND